MKADDFYKIKSISGSPLYMVSLYRVILCNIFGDNKIVEDDRFRWEQDPNNSKIIIEPIWNMDKEQRNKRPAIYIGCDGYKFEDISIGGNRVAANMNNSINVRHSRITYGISFNCDSTVQHDSSSLAFVLSNILVMSEQPIRKYVKINDISMPMVSATDRLEIDKEVWRTVVRLGVSTEMEWFNADIVREKITNLFFTLNNEKDGNVLRQIGFEKND